MHRGVTGPRSPGSGWLSVAVGVVVVVVGGAIVLGLPESQRAQSAQAWSLHCPADDPSDGTTAPIGLSIVCLDGSGRIDLGLPRDASSVDLTADGSTVTFLTADVSVGFCGGCGSGPPYQAIVAMGRTVGDFVSGDDPNDLKNSPYPMPAWSPDGGSIAYRDAAGDLQVQEVGPHENVIGDVGPGMRNVAYRRLTDDPGGDEFPAWSPDGSVIVYSNTGAVPVNADGFSPTQEIWSVDSSGGEPTQLTHNDVIDTQPDVSSDGTVAFMRDGRVSDDGARRERPATPGGDRR